MYSKVEGKVIVENKDGEAEASYKSVRHTKAPIGPEAWISFNLVKYNGYENGKQCDWDSYLVEVNIWGDNSDTTISSSMNIDLITFDEAEAVKEFEAMFEAFTENMKKR